MVEVINRQRKVEIDLDRWHKFTAKAMQLMPASDRGVTVVFVSDRAMREINRTWRGKRGTTDVLSFSAGLADFEQGSDATLGDVVISVEQARKQSTANGLTLEQELSQLILHGLLHLSGYDHEADDGEMNRLELKLRQKLKI